MPKLDAEPRKGCKCVYDEPTPVTGIVIALVGTQLSLDNRVDTDAMTYSLILSLGMCLTSLDTVALRRRETVFQLTGELG